MKKTKCCVPGCTSVKQQVYLHAFPRSQKKFQLWLISINDPRLFAAAKATVFNAGRVCRRHFEAKYLRDSPGEGSRFTLTPNAYPTLFSEDEIANGFAQNGRRFDYRVDENRRKDPVEHDHTYISPLLIPWRNSASSYDSNKRKAQQHLKADSPDIPQQLSPRSDSSGPLSPKSENSEPLSPKCDNPDPLALPQCRLCGEVANTELQLDSPCEPPYDDLTFRELIYHCFSLHVSAQVMGSAVCGTCVERLMEAWHFRSQVAGADCGLLDKLTDNQILSKDDSEIAPQPKPRVLGISKPVMISIAPREQRDILLIAPREQRDILFSNNGPSANCTDKKLKRLIFKDEVEASIDVSDSPVDSEVQVEMLKVAGETISRRTASVGNIKTIKMPRKPPKVQRDLGPGSLKYLQQTLKRQEQLGRFTNAALIIRNSYVLPFSRKHAQYRCAFCTNTFDFNEQLREHTTTQHDVTTAEFEITKVVLFNVDVTVVDCRLCSESIIDLDTLVEHLRSEHSMKFYESVGHGVIPYRLSRQGMACVMCGERFEQFRNMSEHMKVHFAEHKCQDCGKLFLTMELLKNHHYNRHRITNHPCPTCGKIFKNKMSAMIHDRKVHILEKVYKCGECTETFRTFKERQSHRQSDHGIEPERFVCSICHDIFPNKAGVFKHRRRKHADKSPMICKFCGKEFFEMYTYKQHENYHLRRKLPCDMCNRTMADTTGLRRHKKLHDICPYSCLSCGQPFQTENRMRNHVRAYHSDQSPRAQGKKISSRQKRCEQDDTSSEREETTAVQRAAAEKEQREALQYLLLYNDDKIN